ncbi:expressed protein [Phakopsora pachyrhizi]|uniref:Expressed protein n=1 Tax=Phakopsora pachyrhizi TaxID=170000 RepID=A0AAV0BHW4_PHAPC|nr:expressed protein [Phakopsora pachyrhizi]
MKRRNRSDESRGSLNLTKSLKTLNNRSSSNRFLCLVLVIYRSKNARTLLLKIRIDSIHIIDILLRLSPGSVTGGWPIDGNSHLDSLSGSVCQESFGLRLVRLYLSLVGCESRKNSSNQTTQLSSESKLIVFRSLARFIKLSTVEESDRDDETSRRVSNRMFKNEFSDQSGYNSFVSLTTTAPAKFTRNDTVADHHPERRSPEMIIPSNLLGVDPCDENSHRFESFSEAFLIQNQGYTTHFNQNDESDEKFKLNQKPDLKNSSDSNHDVYHKSSQRDEEHFSPDSPLKLLRLLNPIILSTLLDTMPDIFTNQILQNNHKNPVRNSRCDDAIGGGSVKLELVWSLMSILRDLWRLNYYSCGTGHGRDDDCDESMAEEDRKSLEGLVGRISCYFVFGDENVFKVDLATRRILDELNLIYCDLVSLLSLSRNRSKSNNNIKQTKTDSKFKIQLGRVGDYIIERVLKRQENEVFKRILDVDDFRSVLGVIWLLIKKGSKDHSRSSDGIRGDDRSDGDAAGEDEGEDACEDISSKVLEGLVDYLEALKLNSEVRALGYEFIFKIFVLDDLRGSDCFETLDQFSETTQLRLVELVLKLPKLIFELGNKNPRFTIMILSFLHRLVSRPMNFFRECLPGLIKQLVPLFCYYSSNPATANKRDNRDGEDEMRMISLGLYSKMPSECQLLMRSIAWYLVNQDDIPCEGLRFAIERAGATV